MLAVFWYNGDMSVIEIKNLKKYFGKTKAVDDISLDIKEGEIFGFLGPNGAGKTTAIRCMMDFIRPDEGDIKILGLNAQKDTVALKGKIGYLASEPRLYDNLTGKDHIMLLKAMRGNSEGAEDLIKKFYFEPQLKVRNLSSGNKQKLSLILALMSEPEILVLDEPTLGLDPLLQNTIYEILRDFVKKGRTVFMSSHNLSEVERICSRVSIIKEGKLVATESIQQLKKKRLYTIHVYFDQKYNKADFKSDRIRIIEEVPDGLIFSVKGDINPVIKNLNKYKLKDLEIKYAGLEEIFLEFYKRS